MGLNASKVEAPKGNFKHQPWETGNFLGRLVQVIDMGVQTQQPYQGQEKPPAQEIMLTYELGTEFLRDEEGNDIEDKPRWISETIPLRSLEQDLAKSTKRLKALDPKLESEGDFAKLLGAPCTVTVVTKPKKNDPNIIYGNVGNITPAMKGIPVPELVNPAKVFDLTDPDIEIFNSFPEWVQDKIKNNLEYNGSKLQKLIEGEPVPEQGDADESGEDNPY